MGIRVNLNGVEPQQGSGGGPLPDGTYVVRINSATQRVASTGTPGFEFEMEVVVGEFEGRKVWDRLWFTANTAGQVRWKMECAGITIPNGEFTVEPGDFERKRVKIVVRQEQFVGKDGTNKTRAAVQGWEAPLGGSQQGNDPFGASQGAQQPLMQPPAPPAGTGAYPDDDIPF